MTKTYMIVGAHPDDDELSAGLTALLALEKGYDVISVTLSQGGARNKQVRKEEWDEANRRMGYTEAFIFNYPDTMLDDKKKEIRKQLEELRTAFNPDIVIYHSSKDTHQDHVTVHDVTRIAFRNGPDLWEMQSPSTEMPYFQPHKYVKTEDVIVAYKKAWAVGAYSSQCDIASPTAVLAQLQTTGRHLRTKQFSRSLNEIVEQYEPLVQELVQWNPLQFEEVKGKVNLFHIYLSQLLLYPPGTLFAEAFELNHEVHVF